MILFKMFLALSAFFSGPRPGQRDENDLQRCFCCLLLFPPPLPRIQLNLPPPVFNSHRGQPWLMVQGLFHSAPTELLLVGFIQFYLVASVTSEHVAVGGARWSSIVNIVKSSTFNGNTNIASVTFFLKVTVYASLILSCLLLAPFMISCLRWGWCWYWWWWWLCWLMYAMTMAVTN